jgi:hypothetical protein
MMIFSARVPACVALMICAMVSVGCSGGGGSRTSTTASSTTPPPDITAPTVPAGLVATPVSATQINLAWTAATDNVGVTAYKVYQGDSLIANLGNVTSYSNTGLTASTAYSYTVAACDVANNCSARSVAASATTTAAVGGGGNPPPPDTTAPSVPAALTATIVSGTQINLSWTASTDNVGVSGYKVYRNGALIVSLGNVTNYSDTGQSNPSANSYTVAACDAANNCSAQSVAASVMYPSSGTYAPAFRAQGTIINPILGEVASPILGVSLIHPGKTGVEFVIEPSSSAVGDFRVVASGSVAASAQTVSNIQPYALLYILGGDVRRLPLVANGAAPATQVKTASSTTKPCHFVADANDYATPDNSRYVVSTSGADGICGTSDDGQAEVKLDSSGGVSFTPMTNNADIGDVLGMVQDPATLAPTGWVRESGIEYWNPASTMHSMRSNGDPWITRVVGSTFNSALAEYNNQLTIWSVASGPVVTETKLDATLTAGTGWKMAGYDKDNLYVYRNDNSVKNASVWTMLKISRALPTATLLNNGKGTIELATMGSSMLYATVTDTAAYQNRLHTISKATGVIQTLKSTPITTVYTVLTSASGVHEMLQGSYNLTTKTISAGSLAMIDEQGLTLYSVSGGAPLAQPGSATRDFNKSVNSSCFVFATGYTGSRMYGDAALLAYNTATKSATTLGTLPGTSAFSSSPVLAIVTGTSTNFMTGIAGRMVNNALQDAGEQVFSFDTSVPNSLHTATSKQ